MFLNYVYIGVPGFNDQGLAIVFIRRHVTLKTIHGTVISASLPKDQVRTGLKISGRYLAPGSSIIAPGYAEKLTTRRYFLPKVTPG